MSPTSDVDHDLSSTISVESTSPAPERGDSFMAAPASSNSPEAFSQRQTPSIPAFPPSSTDSVPVDPPSPSPSPSPEQSSSRHIVTRSQQQPSPITLAAAARSVKRRSSPQLEPDSHVVEHLRPPVRRRLEDDTPV
ncbi:hypothetical protein SISSUDRAFT_285787 [Sistotremastrum suecicum HHB10207 ss-3]|uniref:Uncharacterized protein n=1 Tax=Sistotremastrum suecicum HHB10207 ss-3 TaxID=1314776 RepID=A0A166GBT0_9AGAM|nr:hypothetical protein SISSUDRAFT_285787 [Sistotremastrum suecicum HHB10207 ss-3]